MPCFSPLPAWRGEFGSSGKRSVVFKAGEAAPGLSCFMDKLPCGQCIGCRLDYALDWSVRCECEIQMHEKSCFITLSYDDAHLPKDSTLRLDHWQKFMKRLRKLVGPVRHFHAGEYGSLNGRPHDHALLFGFDFPDRTYFKMTQAGSKIYRSKILEGLWSYGYSSVGDASFESAGYLARYLIGKPSLTRQIKDDDGFVVGRTWSDKAIEKYGEKVDELTGEISLRRRPEYLTMSRDDGLGKSWFLKFTSDVYPRDYVLTRSGLKMPPPRYFDSLYEVMNPVDYARIKRARMARCSKKEEVWNDFLVKFQLLDVARDERLKVMEEVKLAQVSFLKKGLVNA